MLFSLKFSFPAVLCCAIALIGCGQKGPLMLADEQPKAANEEANSSVSENTTATATETDSEEAAKNATETSTDTQ